MDGLRTWTLLLACLTLHAALMQTALGQENSEDLEDLETQDKDLWELEKGSEEESTEDMNITEESETSNDATSQEQGLGDKANGKNLQRRYQAPKPLTDLEYYLGMYPEGVCSGVEIAGVKSILSFGKRTEAYCHVDEKYGQWTVIQKRESGHVNFYRNWAAYRRGFGHLSGEFWLGNDNIHSLTSRGHTLLRIDLEDWENNKYTVYYDHFKVGGAQEKYKLSVSGFTGQNPPGDSFTIHNGMKFSTYDQDNDIWSGNCATDRGRGGWWYTACHYSNLNGVYNDKMYAKGISWHTWKGLHYSLKKTMMMVRQPWTK